MSLYTEISYKPDVLGDGFEAATIVQPDDYEGKVVFTLIRKCCTEKSSKAVLYVHGFNDYFFQREMAELYLLNGYHFYAIDLRKYGRSHLGHQRLYNVRDLSEYDRDIDIALEKIRLEGNTTVLLSGHSTGGLIVSLYADKNKDSELFHSIFLNSPFWDMNLHPFLKKVGTPLAAWWGRNHPDQLVKGDVSPLYGMSLHQDFYGEWDYDLNWKPIVSPPVNCGWIRAVHLGHISVKRGLVINKPILLVHSAKSVYAKKWSSLLFTGDAVLNVKDMDRLAVLVQGKCKVAVVDGALHDVVLSKKPVRTAVYKVLFNWLNSLEAAAG